MAIVQKGNVQYTVTQETVKVYLAQGFDVLDEETGEVLEKTQTLTLENAASVIEDHKREISALENENQVLRTEKEALTAQIKTLTAELKAAQK